MLGFATDSAAAATAMACGEKTYNGAVAYGLGDGPGARVPLPSVVEFAQARGLATGVVTDVPVSDATPACFLTHAEHRDDLAAIAAGILAGAADVVMGCGHPHYDNDGLLAPADPTDPLPWQYVGGPALWAQLAAGLAGGERPWRLIETRDDFAALAAGTLVLDRVFGVPQVHESLQFDRSGETSPGPAHYHSLLPPFTDPPLATVPSLATMALGALATLARDPDGFLLVVESGALDSGGHARLLSRSIEELLALEEAVGAIVAWVEAHGGWAQTFVLVTGDHETDYLWGEGVDADDPATWFAPLEDRGAGAMPGFRYYSAPQGEVNWAGHANRAIPLFARGEGVELLAPCVTLVDPVAGPCLDNTSIAAVIRALLDATVTTAPATAGAAVVLQPARPNPCNPATTIPFSLREPAVVSLRVFDARGRAVRTLLAGRLAAGAHSAAWDGRDDRGRGCASGAYLVRLAAGAAVAARTVTLRR